MTDKLEHFKNLLYHYTVSAQYVVKIDALDSVSATEKSELLAKRDVIVAFVAELIGDRSPLIPDSAPGHWDSGADNIVAHHYAQRDRCTLNMADVSDFTLAEKLTMSTGLSLEEARNLTTAARQRLKWLSSQLARRRG